MKLIIVCVRDRATDSFGRPVFVAAVGQAIRSFSDEVNSEGAERSDVAKHPEDYDLYQLGTYDDEFGSFDTHLPKQIAVGKDLKLNK